MLTYSFEILGIVVLIVLNGLFALSELAIVSARKARLQHLVNTGNLRARVALDLANDPERFLSTVQVGITLVGILTGAVGGVTLSESIERWLVSFPLTAGYAEPLALALVVIPITVFSIIVGELIPKQVALRNPERIALLVALPMRTLSAVMHPVVRLLSFSTRVIIRAFGIRGAATPSVTEEEIKVMLEEGTKAGTFNETEQEMVERVFRLADKRVSALMTPRTEIVWLDTEDPADENLKKITGSPHSFFPVCKGTIDTVLGVVHVKDLFSASLSGRPVVIQDHLRQPLYVVESMPAVQLIEQFKATGVHFAFLVDEYGGIQGLITLNDVLKAVVGQEIENEDKTNPFVVQRADGSYLVDGALMIDEFRELFGITALSDEETGNYQTVAGLVINQMGRIPSAGQFILWKQLRIEVVDMDGNRIDKLLISRTAPAAA